MTTKTYTLYSDSAYITNGALQTSGSVAATTEGDVDQIYLADTSNQFCIRIHQTRTMWRGDRPLIVLPLPQLGLHIESEVQVVGLGRFQEIIEVRGHMFETAEGTAETAYTKESYLRDLMRQSENGYSLVIGIGSDQRVFGDTEHMAFPKRIDIIKDAKKPRGGPSASPKYDVTMICAIGKNLVVKS